MKYVGVGERGYPDTSEWMSWHLDLSDTPKPKVAFYVETPPFLDYYLFDMTEISDKQKKRDVGLWARLTGRDSRRNKQKERYVRQRKWWAGNDSRRGSAKYAQPTGYSRAAKLLPGASGVCRDCCPLPKSAPTS